jgi:hypothetical protein
MLDTSSVLGMMDSL